MISPQRATRKPAPLAISKSRTVTVKPVGRPRRRPLSESEFWVFAMQMGRSVRRLASNWASFFLAAGVSSTPSAPVNTLGVMLSFSSTGRGGFIEGLERSGWGLSAACTTIWARFLPPSPPWEKMSAMAQGMPRSAQCATMASSSSWESSKNLLTATTTGRL